MTITAEERETILQSFTLENLFCTMKAKHGLKNKAILFNFDVTMGSWEGAEVCELIAIFMLSLIGNKYDTKNIGLYRDDGLAIFKNTSDPQFEKIKKTFEKMFKNKGLDIIIKCNLKIVDYLEVSLNLNDGSCRPYRKPNEETN